MAVQRQLASRAHSSRLDEPEFQMRRWRVYLDDYNVHLALEKGKQNEDKQWDWSTGFDLMLQDSDIDSLVIMIREFCKVLRRNAYTQQQSQTEPSFIISNPFIVTRDNKIVSLHCTINVNTTPDGQRRASRETEFRVYQFDGNWDAVKALQQDAYNKRPYSGVTPMYVFKISNMTRVRGMFVYEDAEQLETLLSILETCVLKDSAVFVDHFRNVSENNGQGKNYQANSSNVGYNNKIPASGEPDMPSASETEFPF